MAGMYQTLAPQRDTLRPHFLHVPGAEGVKMLCVILMKQWSYMPANHATYHER
jgi:hypothetical protein